MLNLFRKKAANFFTAEERIKYNDLMGKADTEDQAVNKPRRGASGAAASSM